VSHGATNSPRSGASWRLLGPLVTLLAAAGVFLGVLLGTPPGPVSLPELLLGPARGARGAAEAYAVGAAASLSLLTLLVIAGLFGLVKLVDGWRHR
jgi:hypothetical protein